jgi:hypothetical protein
VQTKPNQSQKSDQKPTHCAVLNPNSRLELRRLNGAGFPPRVALKAFNGSAKSAGARNPGSGTACGACIASYVLARPPGAGTGPFADHQKYSIFAVALGAIEGIAAIAELHRRQARGIHPPELPAILVHDEIAIFVDPNLWGCRTQSPL